MSAFAVPLGTVPRADVPWPASHRGFFAFAATRLRALSAPFLFFAGYLFVCTSAVDEEWAGIGALKLRVVLGVGALLAAITRSFRGGLAHLDTVPGAGAALRAWLAFLVVGTLATIWAFDLDLAAPEWTRQATAFLPFLLVGALVRTRREVLLSVLVFCAGSGFYLARSVQEYLAGKIDSQMGVLRMLGAGSSAADPNSFAATVVFSLPLMIWTGIRARPIWIRLLALGYGGVAAMCVVQTHSRSGLILLALTLAWTFLQLPGLRSRIALAAVVVGIGVFAVSGLSVNAVKRYESIFSSTTYTQEESTHGRIDGYVVAFKIAHDRPVLGVGPGNWSAYRSKRVDGDTLLPHNLTGQVLASFGWVGFFTFLVYLVSSFRAILAARGMRHPEEPAWDAASRALIGSTFFLLVLHLVSGIAAHNLEREGWTWAPALAIAAATCRRDRFDVPVREEPA